MKFVLEIELGNEAMQTLGDVSTALRRVSMLLADYGLSTVTFNGSMPVHDMNGNTVGKWQVSE